MLASPPESPEQILADVCRHLRPSSQTTLIHFARFLRLQEAEAGLEPLNPADEAEWNRQFSDPVKMAKFGKWADQVLTEPGTEAMDFSRL
ncbi:MAG: hypothetical protein V4726_12190 [Verrucomicrobiota bacterium]